MKTAIGLSGKNVVLCIALLLVVIGIPRPALSESLKIDFTPQGGRVYAGWQGFFARHERLSSFTTQHYFAFDADIDITPTWRPGAVNTTAQMYERGGDDGTDAEDLLRDWIGTDAREPGDPMTLTIAGLPPGTYHWTSYHHDTHDQTGLFDVTVTDATGSVTTTDIDITSTWNDGIVHLADVTTFQTTITSNGVDPVSLTFDCQGGTGHVSTVFFLMNGFELEQTEAGLDRAFGPAPAHTRTGVPTTTALTWQAPTEYTPDSYDVYFGTAPNPYDNPRTTVYTNRFQPTQELDFETVYTWVVDTRDNGTVYPGYPWSFTTVTNRATNPDPADGQTDVSVTPRLTWTPGVRVTSQDVYFGTEPNAYDNPKDTVDVNYFEPPVTLDFGTTYTWVVDTHDHEDLYTGNPWHFTTTTPIEPGDHVAGNLILINDNAGWCWYQDEKVIYDPVAGCVITSTAATSNGLCDASGARGNDVDVTTFNPATGQRTRVLMSDRGGDDHNMGALWIRPDGRYLHMHTGHNWNDNSYCRITTDAHDGSTWDPEFYFNWETLSGLSDSSNATYHNVHYLSAEGRLYNITRQFLRSPNVAYSDDWGETWHYAGKISTPKTGSSYSNGYYKFASNGIDRIDFICTEHHPRNYNNSIYHGYVKGGKSYNSFGTLIDDTIFDEDAPGPEAFSPVFVTSPVDSNTYHTAWTIELELDAQGLPVCLFITRYGTEIADSQAGDADHRLFYARFNGSVWTYTELCKMGHGLYKGEQDYTGLGAIHPDDANQIYISTPFDPRGNIPLAHREIFKGVTPDHGLTWDWTQITVDSTVDNVRPAIPKWDPDHTAAVWARGTYYSQSGYDLAMVCLIDRPDETVGPVTYVDANSINTTLADGSTFTATGPDAYPNATNDQWHEYTRSGNAGSLYMAGASSEDAPMLKTTITDLADRTYDVFAYFWCDPDEDWGVIGGFSPSDMLAFNRQSSQQAEASQFAGPVEVIDIEVALYRVYIGRTQVTNGSAVDVYIDDFDDTWTKGPTLTTYDGVGVAQVTSN